MKHYLGLLLLLLSYNSLAGDKNAVLMLKGVVQPKSKIQVKVENNVPKAVVQANFREKHLLPKITVQKKSVNYLVSVSQP